MSDQLKEKIDHLKKMKRALRVATAFVVVPSAESIVSGNPQVNRALKDLASLGISKEQTLEVCEILQGKKWNDVVLEILNFRSKDPILLARREDLLLALRMVSSGGFVMSYDAAKLVFEEDLIKAIGGGCAPEKIKSVCDEFSGCRRSEIETLLREL